MLREQVLTEWKNYKERVTNFKKFVDSLEEAKILPSFPLGLATTKRNLDFWTSYDFCQKLNASKQKILADIPDNSPKDTIMFLQMDYIYSVEMFKELTWGWKKEIDDNSSGPTIEEVD